MKRLKMTSILLAAILLLCSCNNETNETSASQETTETTETTKATETTETTEDTEETESEEEDGPAWDEMDEKRLELSKEPLLGFENWYVIRRSNDYGYAEWSFYTEDDICFGCQFGTSIDEPNIRLRDLDGDGMKELICMNIFMGDGANRIFIYRNNNGVIEEGTCEQEHLMELYGFEDLCVLAYDEFYDDDNDRMILTPYYENDGKPIELTLDAFTFGEYIINYDSYASDMGPALGFDNCYCTGKTNTYGITHWEFFDYEDQHFATVTGYGSCTDADIGYVDADGDGINEIAVKIPVEKGGSAHTFIIRNNDGTIEIGSSDDELEIKDGMGFEGFVFEPFKE